MRRKLEILLALQCAAAVWVVFNLQHSIKNNNKPPPTQHQTPSPSKTLGLCHTTGNHRNTPLHKRTDKTNPRKPFWGTVHFSPVPRFVMSTHDPTSEDIFISGSVHAGIMPWDQYIWDLFARTLHANNPGIVVDVGANIGYFSMMALAMGRHVVAFEPMERNVERLLASTERNGFSERVTVYQNAVANEAGHAVAIQPTNSATNYGNGHIIGDVRHTGTYGVDYVETIRLDDAVSQTIALMKIDVEGMELPVLDGARGLICSGAVRHITMEWSDATNDNPLCSGRRALETLAEIGYVISDVVPGAPKLHPLHDSLPPNLLLTLPDGVEPQC